MPAMLSVDRVSETGERPNPQRSYAAPRANSSHASHDSARELLVWLPHDTMLDCRRELFHSDHGETTMGDKGSKDKGKREQKKKAQLSPMEKRKLKREKKNK